jgi:hypothetical protein
MRVLTSVIAQLAVSAFLTASVMAFVVIAVPAMRDEPRLGLGIMVGICAGCCALVAFVWPRWRRK